MDMSERQKFLRASGCTKYAILSGFLVLFFFFTLADAAAPGPPKVQSIAAFNSTLSQAEPYYMGSLIRIRANISDPDGNGDISTVLLNLSWPNGINAVTNAAMTNILIIDANTSTYEYNYNLPQTTDTKGAWNISIRANDTSDLAGTNSTAFNATTCVGTENQNLTVSSTITMIGSCNFNNVTITGTGIITTVQGYGLNLSAKNLTILLGGIIDVSGKGYAAGTGPGARGSSYGSLSNPVDLGSGGTTGTSGANPSCYGIGGAGGKGGGLVTLNVTGTLTNNGMITASGGAGGGSRAGGGGGGSGGTIYLDVGVLTGNGSISSNGGNRGSGGGSGCGCASGAGYGGNSGLCSGSGPGGSGGGGRLAIYYASNSYIGTITAYGGGANYGGAGTIYRKAASQSYGDLLVDNNGNSGAATPLNSSAYSTVFDAMAVQSGAVVTSVLSILPLNATALMGNGTISMGTSHLVLRTSNISMLNGLITSSSGNINITMQDRPDSTDFNATFSTTSGVIRIFYGLMGLETRVSAAARLTRTFSDWSDNLMKWNDTASAAIMANYNMMGMLANAYFNVYNTSAGEQTNPYNLTADSNGVLPSFTIKLNGNTEIKLKFTPPPPLPVLSTATGEIVVSLSGVGQMIMRVKNAADITDAIELSIAGTSKLHHWIWFNGHRYDEKKYKQLIIFGPGEEKAIAVDIFGGEVTTDPLPKIIFTATSSAGQTEVSKRVRIVYSDDGLNAATPEFGWVGFLAIALIGALLL